MQREFDWRRASHEDRARLYRAVKQLIDSTSLDWNAVYAAAFGLNAEPGIGYEDNFRAGRIGRKKAALIYGWLCREHPEVAAKLNAELQPRRSQPPVDWESFLLHHGTYGEFEIVPLDGAGIGIVTFAEAEPVADRIIKRGQPFCFQLEAGFEGAAIGFQWAREAWHALPLSRDGLFASVKAGSQYLPWDNHRNAPAPLKEDTDLGRHRFAVLLVQERMQRSIARLLEGAPLSGKRLDSVAALLAAAEPEQWRLYRLNVIFEA